MASHGAPAPDMEEEPTPLCPGAFEKGTFHGKEGAAVAAVCLPPLAVAMVHGPCDRVWCTSLILTIIGCVPGCIYSLAVVRRTGAAPRPAASRPASTPIPAPAVGGAPPAGGGAKPAELPQVEAL